MDEQNGLSSLMESAAEAIGRDDARFSLASESSGPWASRSRAEVERGLRELRESGLQWGAGAAWAERAWAPFRGSPNREPEWLSSRRALLNAASARPDCSVSARLSLSHCRTGAVALMGWSPVIGDTIAIGIDLEPASRSLSDRLDARIRHPEDEADGLLPIGIWSAKEALYKAGLGSARFAQVPVRLQRDCANRWLGMWASARLAVAANNDFVLAVAAL